ncbi:DUF2569 family protein [Geobacter sp. AOG1]|uniref:DUF2569 family protein n=1 Tax=Geobacter sp. AOG1 TaxID=1566346 RepID=UPI001CC5E21A|nr:DUF2569 family protein [Geobacter sp. AOG1]GFE59273.1 hypothetical protein AOG1_31530 [Geobacter sp. AOG1]
MAWDCPSCGYTGNDDETLRCSCGHENLVYEAPNFNKIDGALIFVAVGLIISVITILSSFTDAVAFAAGGERFAIMIIGAIIVIIPIGLLMLLFKRKRSFPRYIKLWYLANLIVAYLNFLSIKASPDTPEKIKTLNNAIDVLALTFIGCCIWVTYFFVSARVKKTFVR